MTRNADQLNALRNELADVLLRHGASAVCVFANAAGDATLRLVTPADDGSGNVAFPRALWDKVQDRLLREADLIRARRCKTTIPT